MTDAAPTLPQIRAAREQLGAKVRVTPSLTLPMRELDAQWPSDTQASFKLELLQVTGTFKPRGALNVMQGLDPAQRSRGVTAVSAGNHAVAVAYAAKALGVSAHIVMYRTANPLRLALARSFGAEIELADPGPTAFARVKEIEASGRHFVHPFEGRGPVTGTATVGLEWIEQSGELEAVVVACGGGGLLAGVAAAVKQLAPATRVYGVEPEGADAMNRSFESGQTTTLSDTSTIADSLAPPMTTPYTFAVCRQFVDRMVRVGDADIRKAMQVSFRALKLAVEPAGATALAGALGPLREELSPLRRIGILVCGANIDAQGYCAHLNA